MKKADIKVGKIYVNRGAGRTQRKVLAIDVEYQPVWLGDDENRPPDNEPGVLFEQDGSQECLYLSAFARWAKGEVQP
jgi:hypothetical protein